MNEGIRPTEDAIHHDRSSAVNLALGPVSVSLTPVWPATRVTLSVQRHVGDDASVPSLSSAVDKVRFCLSHNSYLCFGPRGEVGW